MPQVRPGRGPPGSAAVTGPGSAGPGLGEDPGFRSPALVRLLLQTGEEAVDPNVSHELGLLALTVLDQIEAPALQVLAYCLIGEAQRRKGNVEIAGDILKSAAVEIELEPVSSPVRARFCRTLAAIRADQSRIDEALALLERACSICEDTGDFAELARARLEEGLLLLEELEYEMAFVALSSARPLLDPETHPRLALSTLHALALTCADLGRTDILRQVLEELEALRPFLPDRLDPLRIRWIRAQIHWRLGEVKPAIKRLQRVFSALLEAEAPGIETATAGLELARMHLGKQVPSKASVYQDLLRALRPLALQGALSAGLWAVLSFALGFAQLGRGYSVEVLDSAIRYLQPAQYNPKLSFHPLSDPDETVSWGLLSKEARRASASAAGVELVDDEPASPRQRRVLAWTHEALTGVRVQLPDDGVSPEDETLPG